jgi:hypothetical protein
MRGFTHSGKQVMDGGEHFADAATEIGARLICAALNYRNHRPVVNDGEVVCSRCLAELPRDGEEPCIPRAARCPDTPDLFEGPMPHTGTEPRRCHCGEPAVIIINNVPLCQTHGDTALARPKAERVAVKP